MYFAYRYNEIEHNHHTYMTHRKRFIPKANKAGEIDLNTYTIRKIRSSTAKRARMVYSIAIIFTILLGLASRKWASILPDIVVDHAGDALWAIMIYLGLRIIVVYKRVRYALIGSLLFCYLIECSQLYQALWINEIRRTMLGGLILGKGFLWIDLVRYTLGIGAISIVDSMILKSRRRKGWITRG